MYVGDFSPNVRPVPALRARVLAAHGRVERRPRLGRRQGLAADDDLSYLREFEHVTLARVLLARHTADGDRDSLREAAAAGAAAGRRGGGRPDRHGHRDPRAPGAGPARRRGHPGALVPLERALTLAEPEGYVRVFAGEGLPMADLLTAVGRPARRVATTFAASRRLRATYRRLRPRNRQSDGAPAAPRRLVEPLSARELDVLRLLSTDLDGPDIARHLVVSLNTVRTHTKNIYAKLGVNSRRAAVTRAEELGLLSHPTTLTPPPSRRPQPRRLRESPRRSPHVVMSAHHIASYVSVTHTAATPRTREGNEKQEPACATSLRRGRPGPVRNPLPGAPRLRWATRFDGMTLTTDEDGTTVMEGLVVDQAALHGLLAKLRDIGLPLVSVTRMDPTCNHTAARTGLPPRATPQGD